MSTAALIALGFAVWLVVAAFALGFVRSMRMLEADAPDGRAEAAPAGAGRAGAGEARTGSAAGAARHDRRRASRPWTGPPEDPLVARMRAAQKGVQGARAELTRVERERDLLVRRALASGVDVRRVVEVTGLSRAEIERRVA